MNHLIIAAIPLLFCCKSKPQSNNLAKDQTQEGQDTTNIHPLQQGSLLAIKSQGSLAKSTLVGSIDTDGDGEWELLRAQEGQIDWQDQVFTVEAKPQAITTGEHNGKPALFIGFGQGKKYPRAPIQIWRATHNSVEKIYTKSQSRNIISDLHFENGNLFMAAAQDDGSIGSGWISNGGFSVIHRQKLALRQLPLNKDSIAVGRVYGDTPKSDGDLHIVDHQTGTKKRIKTFRGIRALHKADINNDDIQDLLVSDGWHYKYGEAARARVRLHLGPDYTDTVTLGDFPNDYTVNRIETWQLENRAPLVLAIASRNAYLLQLSPLGWRNLKICSLPEGGNAVFSRINGSIHVFCSGTQTQKVTLQWIDQKGNKEGTK